VPYKHVRLALTLVFAATLAIGAIHVHGIGALLIAIAGGAALAAWIATHRDEVLEEHAVREARGEEYRREHRKAKPNAFVGIAIMFGCGAAMIAATFADYSKADVRGFLRRILFDILGPVGTVTVCALLAAYFLAMALEFTLGHLWARKQAPAEPQ
jgi:phosphotransferase system  glucose/maltose/N-acetylglucosamine-specific IIC component